MPGRGGVPKGNGAGRTGTTSRAAHPGFRGAGSGVRRPVRRLRHQEELFPFCVYYGRTERTRDKWGAFLARYRDEPGAQQQSFHRIDVDFVETIAVLVARIFASAVADGLVLVAPHRQTSVDAVLVSVDHRAFDDDFLNDRLDRFLLYIGQHPKNDLTIALDQAQDRRLKSLHPRRRVERATAARSTRLRGC